MKVQCRIHKGSPIIPIAIVSIYEGKVKSFRPTHTSVKLPWSYSWIRGLSESSSCATKKVLHERGSDASPCPDLYLTASRTTLPSYICL